MRTRRRRFPLPGVDANLTPMIDIVFNLLIFFMCATKFRTPEGLIEAFLPKNRGGAAGPTEIDLAEVRVKLLPQGVLAPRQPGVVAIKVGDEVLGEVAVGPGARPELAAVWAALHQKLLEVKAAYRGKSEKGQPVIIDARPEVPSQCVVSTLNEVVRAGIQDVTFAAPEKAY